MRIHQTAIVHPNVLFEGDYQIEPYVILGSKNPHELVTIGDGALIRAYSRIHGKVRIGTGFQTGNHTLIKGSDVQIGDNVLVGSYSSIEGPKATVGNDVKIQGRVEMSMGTVKDRARIYAGTILSDMRRPPDGKREPPTIGEDSVLGLYALIMAGVTIGKGCFVAAQAVALKDVPDGHMLKRTGEMVPL